MIATAQQQPSISPEVSGRVAIHQPRSAVAAGRLVAAREALKCCRLCACECRVDRTRGPAGLCGAGQSPRVFSAQIEVGDELEIIPTYAIALSGCNMRCQFCITGEDSWHASRGWESDPARYADLVARSARAGSIKTVQILGGEPTVHLPWLVEFVSLLPDQVSPVLKTNGLVTESARGLLQGLFDVWLVDFKFGNDVCARELSGTRGYLRSISQTLFWAESQANLIIRHLVMPGHVDCCFSPIAEWIARQIPDAKVSLRSGYWPSWKALQIPGMNRVLRHAEQARAHEIARHYGLHLVA